MLAVTKRLDETGTHNSWARGLVWVSLEIDLGLRLKIPKQQTWTLVGLRLVGSNFWAKAQIPFLSWCGSNPVTWHSIYQRPSANGIALTFFLSFFFFHHELTFLSSTIYHDIICVTYHSVSFLSHSLVCLVVMLCGQCFTTFFGAHSCFSYYYQVFYHYFVCVTCKGAPKFRQFYKYAHT